MRDDDERPTDAHAAVSEDDAFPADGETVTTVDEHLTIGTNVGGYVVESELGFGGMGVVYAAIHPVIGKRAAIKVLKPDLSKNPAAVERFVMEARAVNQIGHPHIVDIFAFGALPDGRSYYVMDLLNGESLRRRVKRGPLHVSEAASVIDQVASALIAAHDKGIIHRDLKPDNIFMVTAPGRWPEAKLLDWGLLKLTSAQSSVSSSKYRTLAGSVMGTPVYMSPEQARASDQVDFRTDIYALGVMAYELLSGVVPFKKGSSIDTLLAHQDEPVPSLAQKCPSLPVEIVQLIEAMLAKDPDERPTLAAVRAVLKRLTGTKIPTMTAAGLEMTPLPSRVTPPPQHDDPFMDPPTVRNKQFVEPVTRPKPFVEPPTMVAPASFDPRAAFIEPPTVKQPAFVEPPTARQDRHSRPTRERLANPFGDTPTMVAPASFDPKAAFAMDASPALDEVRASEARASEARTAPRLPTPVPGSLPLPAPPTTRQRMESQPGGEESLPYQSMLVAQTTLAGHSMPPQHSSRPPVYSAQVQASIPPMYHQHAAGSLPPQLHQRPSYQSIPPLNQPMNQPSSGKRLLVIIIAAVVASAIGITVALLA